MERDFLTMARFSFQQQRHWSTHLSWHKVPLSERQTTMLTPKHSQTGNLAFQRKSTLWSSTSEISSRSHATNSTFVSASWGAAQELPELHFGAYPTFVMVHQTAISIQRRDTNFGSLSLISANCDLSLYTHLLQLHHKKKISPSPVPPTI